MKEARLFLGALVVAALGACASTPVPDARAPHVREADRPSVAPGADRPPFAPPEGWLGGTETVIVDAPAEVVLAVLADPGSYKTVLPLVRSFAPAGTSGADPLVEIVEGTPLVSGRYTARLHRAREDRIEFSIVRDRPHDVDDAYGAFEVSSLDASRSILRYDVAIDVGGLTRLLFAARIQRAALSVPARVRALAERRARDDEARSTIGAPGRWLS